MSNRSNSIQEMFQGGAGGKNDLMRYIGSLNPEAIAHLSTPTPEVQQAMEANLTALLGALPPSHFDVTVTTSRENLGRMLASAMMNGYFLHSAQQRMAIEKTLVGVGASNDSNSDAGDSDSGDDLGGSES